MPHTITEADLADYVQKSRERWNDYASASNPRKKLEFLIGDIAPIYRVTSGDREIYIGVLRETAVREYNALP